MMHVARARRVVGAPGECQEFKCRRELRHVLRSWRKCHERFRRLNSCRARSGEALPSKTHGEQGGRDNNRSGQITEIPAREFLRPTSRTSNDQDKEANAANREAYCREKTLHGLSRSLARLPGERSLIHLSTYPPHHSNAAVSRDSAVCMIDSVSTNSSGLCAPAPFGPKSSVGIPNPR